MMNWWSNTENYRLILKYLCVSVSLWLIVFLTACSEIQSPKPEPFIGENAPPPKQEFRWSNGKLPKSFDPARAAASPETDIVRALYEGLVDIDSKSLKPVPAIAEKWTSSADNKIWTFELRQDAKWSNGEPVTAEDFVRSWKRLTELGSKVPQRSLLKNIVGMDTEDVLPVFAEEDNQEVEIGDENNNNLWNQRLQLEDNSSTVSNSSNKVKPEPTKSPTPAVEVEKNSKKDELKSKNEPKFGVEAVSKFTLKVSLIHSDSKFPLLIAHPIFRPVYGDEKEFEKNELSTNIITNGAFRLQTIAKDGIILERSVNYWNRGEVKLEIVKFVPTENAEQALAAYRAGEVDVVTNANFQPLALKLLKPFEKEFHQTIHSALNFYEFNLNEKPFSDNRVREALAISIDRKRLTEDEMDGATQPALSFLPFEASNKRLTPDIEKAQKLLTEAGFGNGDNFPTIKLVVNRNNMQQKIARSVARMWLKNLNIKTEIIVKDQADIENLIQTGDFSLARRGVVLPTNNETSNMLVMFDGKKILSLKEEKKDSQNETPANKMTSENQILTEKTAESELNIAEMENSSEQTDKLAEQKEAEIESEAILTEDQAIEQLPAIPLYFPTSYSLVKPYIQGFELNAFDALSLKDVQINSNWQPADNKSISNK